MALCLRLLLCCVIIHVCGSAQIIAVVDSHLSEENPNLELILTKDTTVIISDENDTISTFLAVCEEFKKGASVLLDISSPNVGPLLRSFARANGLVFMTIMDQSFVLPVDTEDRYYIQIQPPGTAMLNVVADIIQFDNLTNVAIIYDDSFNLHQVPRRVVSGILSHHIYQRISKEDITNLLDRLEKLEIENVFVIGSSNTINFVLGKANKFESLIGENVNWFVITKDAEVTCDGCMQKMRMIVADGEFQFESMLNYTNFMKQYIKSDYKSSSRKIDEAFAYDLLGIFDGKIPESVHQLATNSCYGNGNITNETLELNERIINNLKDVDRRGVFGPIVSETHLVRQKIILNLRRLEFEGGRKVLFSKLGHWTKEGGLNITGDSLINEKSQKTYKVVVVPEYAPFIYKQKVIVNGTVTGYKYTGFCKDLFDEIAKRLNFQYELYETDDGYFGSLNDDGTWNGAIKELIDKKAHIAIGPISVMSERENVVDFTVPFHEPVGLTILMRRHKFEYSLHKFLTVLEGEVWGCIVASYFLFSVLMWLFDKFSPFSYQNNPDSSNGPEKRIFTLKEGIWFCMTSLTPQGGGEAPRAVSGRLVAATWWLYGFLLIAFYTANLAAFLTVTRLETSISSLEDLSKQQSVKYGPMKGTSALVYFERMKLIESKFYEIWKDMSLNDSLSPVARAQLAVWDYPVSEQFTKLKDRMFISQSYDEAMTMIKKGEYAFIDDATRNKYQTLTDCDVGEIGEEFSRKPFAFAVVQGSPLRAQISNVILDLANDRIIEDLNSRWWDMNVLKKTCPTIEDESDGISIMNIGGVFLVIAIGTGLSIVAFMFEYYYYKIKPKREARLYNMKMSGGSAKMRRLQSEASMSDFQIQDNGHMNGNNNTGVAIETIDNHRNNNSINGHKPVDVLQNGHTTNSSTKQRFTKKKQNNLNVDKPSVNHNGHVPNGITNTYFTFDTEETMQDRYPNINDHGEIQVVFTEKL